jgi:hypothetical protein
MERTAAWKRQPLKGLLLTIAALVVSILYLEVLAPAMGISFMDASMNYPFVYFFWAFALLGFFELWPFAKLKQPWAGLAAAALSWVLTVPTWHWLVGRMGDYDAFALLSYAMFFLFLIAWFYFNEPAAEMSQPLKGVFLTMLSLVLGWVVYTQIGAIPQMWLYFIPVFLFYYFEYWPVAEYKPYTIGTFWLIFVLAGTWLNNEIQNVAGVAIATPRGTDVASIIFAAMLYPYNFEYWPFEKLGQPLKGIVLSVATFVVAGVLAILAWTVFKVPDYWVSSWCFTVWVWQVVVQWLPAPWPSEG